MNGAIVWSARCSSGCCAIARQRSAQRSRLAVYVEIEQRRLRQGQTAGRPWERRLVLGRRVQPLEVARRTRARHFLRVSFCEIQRHRDLFGILADALAAVPTLTKAYKEPESESDTIFWFGVVNASIGLLIVDTWTFENLASRRICWGSP